MEMATAHGLALKLVEMNHHDRISRNELCEIISEEDKIIKLWYIACQSRFSKKDFFTLVRKTIVFVLSSKSLKEGKKKELLKSVSIYFNQFSGNLGSNMDIRKPLIDVIVDPWRNKYMSWPELLNKCITICDQTVRQYFEAEPEEIVCARAHYFSIIGQDNLSMIMAKNSFLYHTRIANTFKFLSKNSKINLHPNMSRKGIPSMDWYIHNLQRKKTANAVCWELMQLTCDEAVLLIMRMRGLKLFSLALTSVHAIIMLDLLKPAKFCCTKKLFTLWSILHKDMGTPMEQVNEEAKKLVAHHAPSSAHFYLLGDALWEQFGMDYVKIYVELYIRALTADVNHLEVAKHQNKLEDAEYLESQMSSMFFKLSALFTDYHQRVARECMFSAFSLKPNKKMLCILQNMTQNLLSEDNEMKRDFSFISSNASSLLHMDHPILNKGIPNIPYSMVKDLVSILESVRCFRFQYNVFSWCKNGTDLGDYLKDYTLCKSYESDTECEEDGVPVDAQEEKSRSHSEKMNGEVMSLQTPVKRKSISCDSKEMLPFEVVGANIEVRNEEFVNKKIKMEDQSQSISSVSNDMLRTQAKPQEYINLVMENAIENVIRATLDNNRQKPGLALSKPKSVFSSVSFSHGNDESENLSSLYKPVSETSAYPYSLTNFQKEKSINSRTSFNSEVENSFKYNYFPPSSSVLSRALTAPSSINNSSVISPAHRLQKTSASVHEQSPREVNQNKYLLKPINDPYNKSKEIQSDDLEKKVSVYQQQEARNLTSKSSLYGQNRNISNSVNQNSRYISNQTTMQIVHRSNVSSDFQKEQFLNSTSSQSTTPLNLTQPKLSSVQSPQYLSVAHQHSSKESTVLRPDSRYQAVDTVNKTIVKRVNESMCYQDNQLVHCDRSSVIQHTMQHVKEISSEVRANEVEMPNQLAVSVNSDAVELIRNVPKENINKLKAFPVNVSDRSISNSSLAVKANLVIARKPQPQVEVPSQPLSTPVSPVTSDTITIPGVLASSSVIVSPWEPQRKVHGELMYKKNPQSFTLSSIDKRIYKNRPPYARSIPIKSETKIIGHKLSYDKNNNSQVFKTVAMASHNNTSPHSIPSTSQSNTNASQNWVAVNKPSQVMSQTSSQPWYSEPFPKPHSSRNVSSTTTGDSAAAERNTVNAFQPGNDTKSHAVFSKQIHLSKNQTMAMPSVASSLSHSTNNLSSNSSLTPSVHYITTFAAPNSSTSAVANTAVLDQRVAHSSSISTANIKTYSSAARMSVRNCSVPSSTQVSNRLPLDTELTHNQNSLAYSASNIIDNSIQFSQASPRTLQNTCCSPSELNPCQNCSLSSENNLVQTSNDKAPNDHPNEVIPRREKMMLENDVVSAACNTTFPCIKENEHNQYNVSLLNCHHCGNPFSELELQTHILNCASKNLDLKNNLVNEIDSNMLVAENFCPRSLPDVVPEQDSFYQKEPFLNNLPQTTKSFMNVEEDKNLDEIEANAFTACMDLINNDKDLERIVQGMDSLDQIENNYLPYIPPTDPTENFLSNNLCSDVQNNGNLLQESDVYGKINEVNNYNIDHGCPQLQEKDIAVFDFTESVKSVQQPKIIPTSTAKISNELSFADVFKSILTDTSPNEIDQCQYQPDCPSKITCARNDDGLNVDDNHHPPIDPPSPTDQTNFTYAVENVEQQIMKPKKVITVKRKCTYQCPICLRDFANSTFLLTKHIPKDHPGEFETLPTAASCRNTSNIKNFKLNRNKFGGRNSYHNNAEPCILDSNVKQILTSPNVLENGSIMSKGKRKRILKNPQIKCQFCGKLITSIYLKKHIRTQHPVKTENSSDLNTDVSESPAIDSESPVDSITVPSLSPLLEQDFDSSTCLSASDALKKNSSFTVTETAHNSENGDKLVEKTNVKFNFDVLEFSREVESHSKIVSQGNLSLQTEGALLQNIKQENIPLEDFNLQNNLEDKQNLEDKETVSPTKKSKCPICGKLYHSKGNLTRHIKDIHNMKLNKKNTSVNKIENSKIEENQFQSYSDFQKYTKANVESLSVAEKEMPVPLSTELVKIENVPINGASFLQTKKLDYSPHPNSKGNLLKAVLQSNFAKECQLSQKSSKKGNLVQDKQINIIDTSKILQDVSKLPVEELPSTRGSLCENLPNTDPELTSSDQTLVPFEKAPDIQADIKARKCSFVSHDEVDNKSTISTKLSNSSLNNNSKVEENSGIKHLQMTNSQNMSVHSCEISPISQIISNVSKCHFGGTSNEDNKKEVFEDNSLKLLIPKTKDMDTSVNNNDYEEIEKSDNTDSEHGLNCDKKDSDICNQEIKELLHKKLDCSPFFPDNSDIFNKNAKELTSVKSVSVEKEVTEKELCDHERNSQEKESCPLETDISLGEKSFELKNEACEQSDSLLENMSCGIENISQDYESCEFDNVCDLQNSISQNESFRPEKSVLDAKTCNALPVSAFCETENIIELNTVQEDDYCKTESPGITNSSPLKNCELQNSLQSEGSRDFENTSENSEIKNSISKKEMPDLEKSTSKNELFEPKISSPKQEDSLAEKESHKVGNINQEFYEPENIQENEDSLAYKVLCESEENGDSTSKNELNLKQIIDKTKDLDEHQSLFQENEDSVACEESFKVKNINEIKDLCEHQSISQENEDSVVCKESYKEKNIVQGKELCKSEKISLENGDSLSKNESCSEKNIDQTKDLCEHQSISQENGDSVACKESYKVENIAQGKELCESEKISLGNGDSMPKNESHSKENIDQTKGLHENTFQENENSLPKVESCADENLDHKELCESETFSQEIVDSLTEKSFEFTNTLSNPTHMCWKCQQNLDSLEVLTKHLNDFHNIPPLKNISEHLSKKKSTHSQNIKSSPPNLTLGTNESDSESVSDFDSPQKRSKTTTDTSPQDATKNEKFPENYLLTIPSPTKQNILDKDTDLHNLPSTLEKTFECSSKDSEMENLSIVQCLKSPIVGLKHKKVKKSSKKFKRLSLDNIGSYSPVKHADDDNQCISNSFYKSSEKESKSLPDIEIAFPSIAPNSKKCKRSRTKPSNKKKIYRESSLSEDASFSSSITDTIENCKSSSDSLLSSSSSSQNNTTPLNEITINSHFVLPKRMKPSISRLSSKKIILRSRFAGRKLIIQKLKTYKHKKKAKSKLFSRKKKTTKSFKPIVVTLKEATEVNKFLETHKQPIVKLIRLKDKEYDCLSFPLVKCDKINMKPVVKLEKINETALRDKEQFVSNVLQQDTQEFAKRPRKTAKKLDKSHQKFKNKIVPSTVPQIHECIEILSDDSSDSVQYLEDVTKEEKLANKPETTRSTPETKPCFVVLKKDDVFYHM